MEALNQTARTAAIKKFIGIYGLSLLLVLLIAYVLFKTPVRIFKSNLKAYEAAQTEQEKLLSQAGPLTVNLKNIEQADEEYLNSGNDLTRGDLKKNFQQYEKNISDKLVELKNDTAKLISPVTKKTSYNYIAAFDALLTYRHSIDFLRNTLEDKKIDVGMIDKMNRQLNDLTRDNQMLRLIIAKAASSSGQPPVAGGGANNAAMAELQKQLNQCKTELANAKRPSGHDAGGAQLQRELDKCQSEVENLKKQVENGAGITESKKAEVLFGAADDFMQRARSANYVLEKRYFFLAAKQLYEKVKDTYPQPAAITARLSQISAELKKIQQ